MAEQDSFIQEVTEEVRRDRMFSVWKKYGPILIGLIVLAVLGVAAKDFWDRRVAEGKQELGGAFLATAEIEDPGAAAEGFSKLAAEAGHGYPALARLRAGAAFAQAGEPERAVEEYERILAMSDVDNRLRALAELRIVMLQVDTAPVDEVLPRLAPLAAIDSPWRFQALEFEAAAHLRNDDPKAAAASLERIVSDPAVPPTLADRIGELLVALREAHGLEAPAEAAGTDTEETQ